MSVFIVQLTQGNLNNNYPYLGSALRLFPPSAFGGPSDDDLANQLLEVHYGAGQPVMTDIALDKKIFRSRRWVREFFRSHKLRAGDRVAIEQTGPGRCHVYPVRMP